MTNTRDYNGAGVNDEDKERILKAAKNPQPGVSWDRLLFL